MFKCYCIYDLFNYLSLTVENVKTENAYEYAKDPPNSFIRSVKNSPYPCTRRYFENHGRLEPGFRDLERTLRRVTSACTLTKYTILRHIYICLGIVYYIFIYNTTVTDSKFAVVFDEYS